MLLLLGVAARTHDGVTMRGRSRSKSSAIFDPRRQHSCRSHARTASRPSRSGEQALLCSCKDLPSRGFHNRCHAVEGACAIPPLPWSRSPPRTLGRAIFIEPQPSLLAETNSLRSFCQPIRSGTLCTTSPLRSKALGTFLGRAKEGLR